MLSNKSKISVIIGTALALILLMPSVNADDITHKSKLFKRDRTTGTDYCVNKFTNSSCENYYTCRVENSSSYGLGVGPKQTVEITSVCGSAWQCIPSDNPHAGLIPKPKNCKEEKSTPKKKQKIPSALSMPPLSSEPMCQYLNNQGTISRQFLGGEVYYDSEAGKQITGGDLMRNWDKDTFSFYVCTRKGFALCKKKTSVDRNHHELTEPRDYLLWLESIEDCREEHGLSCDRGGKCI